MDEDDVPVTKLFSDQKAERQFAEKQIKKTIIESRSRTRSKRKLNHALRATQSPGISVINKQFNQSSEISPETLNLQLPTDEFNLSTKFSVKDHIRTVDLDDEFISNDNFVSPNVARVHYEESDEGYTGSEEQERLKATQRQQVALIDSEDSMALNSNTAAVENYKPKQKSGRKHRPVGYKGAFHVERFDKLNMDHLRKEKTKAFFAEQVLAPLPRSSNFDCHRIQRKTAINLMKKKQARRRI